MSAMFAASYSTTHVEPILIATENQFQLASPLAFVNLGFEGGSSSSELASVTTYVAVVGVQTLWPVLRLFRRVLLFYHSSFVAKHTVAANNLPRSFVLLAIGNERHANRFSCSHDLCAQVYPSGVLCAYLLVTALQRCMLLNVEVD